MRDAFLMVSGLECLLQLFNALGGEFLNWADFRTGFAKSHLSRSRLIFSDEADTLPASC